MHSRACYLTWVWSVERGIRSWRVIAAPAPTSLCARDRATKSSFFIYGFRNGMCSNAASHSPTPSGVVSFSANFAIKRQICNNNWRPYPANRRSGRSFFLFFRAWRLWHGWNIDFPQCFAWWMSRCEIEALSYWVRVALPAFQMWERRHRAQKIKYK